jgi:hypothetical protein
MRQQRRMAAPVPAPVNRATTEPPTSGYALVVDGQMKTEFKTKDRALKAARDLKSRFPMLHEPDRARRESHLSRDKWMTEHGYRQVLRGSPYS